MSTVHVHNISHQTSEKEVREFFSFCGKIQSLSVTPETSDAGSSQSAAVTFEKETAAKTALLLDNTQLGPAQVKVTAAKGISAMAGSKSGVEDDELSQEDKPRSRIVAEYLAHGYVISDQAIQRALQLDQQHGISTRFTSYLQQWDQSTKASERMQAVDQKYQLSQKGQQAWLGLNSYFEKAVGTQTGQRVRSFYEQGQKQVLDVHTEAKHLANLKQGKPSTTAQTVDSGFGSAGEKSSGTMAEEAGMEKVMVDGKERTKCNCGGKEGNCPCEVGKCACSGCSKAS